MQKTHIDCYLFILEITLNSIEETRYVAEEQNKVIDHFLSGNFFQNANEEEMLNMSG